MSLHPKAQARQQTVAAIKAAAERIGHRIQYPVPEGISLEPPVPCDLKVGDIVTVING